MPGAPPPFRVRLPADDHLPRHIAIIMDGNGRWARERGEERLFGHRAGVRAIRPVVETCQELDIHVVTLYAFSTENWNRPRGEVEGLMELFRETLAQEVPELHEKGIQIRVLGRRDELDKGLVQAVESAESLTAENTEGILNVALNYGSRREILDAVSEILLLDIGPEMVTEELLSSRLYTAGLPDPDLCIRSAGESRLSNFLLWQSAYAEFYVTATLWPDFGPPDLRAAVSDFLARRRKFGGVLSEEV